jgi:hypothetical protein
VEIVHHSKWHKQDFGKVHKYVPFVGDKEEREYLSQPIVGDQLTVEHALLLADLQLLADL